MQDIQKTKNSSIVKDESAMDSSTVMNKDLARFAKSSTNLALGDYNSNVSPKNATKRSVIFKGVD